MEGRNGGCFSLQRTRKEVKTDSNNLFIFWRKTRSMQEVVGHIRNIEEYKGGDIREGSEGGNKDNDYYKGREGGIPRKK